MQICLQSQTTHIIELPNSVQCFTVEDHYSAQYLKGAQVRFECENCHSSLTGKVPLHADAYQSYTCNRCSSNMYIILYKIGGPLARETGYSVFAVSNMPSSFLEYMQPDDGFVDPRDEMMAAIYSGNPEWANNKAEWDNKFYEIQQKVARQRNAALLDGTITIRGKKFPIQESLFVNPGENPKQVVVMTALEIKCPMITTSEWLVGTKRCDTWIGLIADFIPSAWICPACKGLIIVDTDVATDTHRDADFALIFSVSDHDLVSAFCYSSDKLSQVDQSELNAWIGQLTGGWNTLLATPYDQEVQAFMEQNSGESRIFLHPSALELDEVKQRFQVA